jgi:hypothetical protein
MPPFLGQVLCSFRLAGSYKGQGRAGVQRNKAGVNWLLVGMKVGQACQSPASPASPLDNRAINIYFHTLKKFKKKSEKSEIYKRVHSC